MLILAWAGWVVGQTPPAPIARLAAQAEAAAQANKPQEAMRLYRQAVTTAPKWEEGWWHLGTIQYEEARYAECRDSFRRFVALNQKLGAGFAFLGLCEFRTKEFGPALIHLEKAYGVGLRYDEPLTRTALYHAAVLQTHASNFERALQLCRLLTRIKSNEPSVIAVAGIAALRRPIFPQELAAGDRDVAFKLGSAMLTGGEHPIEDAMKRFEELLKEYPNTPNIHYSYAMILLANDPDKGVAALQRELEIDPKHLPALVAMGFEYLKRGDAAAALRYAQKAVDVAPGNFAARGCLGQAWLEMGEPANAVRELETAVKLEPSSSQLHYRLASAYAKLGRTAEAARERAEFARWKREEDGRAEKGAQ